jgi:hypothetical protein
MKFSITVLSATFSHALLLDGSDSGGILPVAGSPPPRVVEPNNNNGPPRSLIRIGSSKGSRGHVTASDDSSPSSDLLLSLSAADNVVAPPREGNAKDDVVIDAGVLTSRVLQAVAPTCTAGYVDCVNGFVSGTTTPCAAADCVSGFIRNTTTPCAAACNGNCCVGTSACDGLTGKVCKDGSCNATGACLRANLSFVVNSCKGTNACRFAGSNKGTADGMVGGIVNSCTGLGSCSFLGGDGGVVGKIQDSCTQNYSCFNTGYQGTVGNIQQSCNSTYSCFDAGSYAGSIGNITSSCIANKSCFKAGKLAASAISSSLKDCCNTAEACDFYTEALVAAVCSVRECNICSPCFILLLFNPCSLFVMYYRKNNRPRRCQLWHPGAPQKSATLHLLTMSQGIG